MAWEENLRICLHMQLIAILSRTEVTTDDYDTQKTLSGGNGQRLGIDGHASPSGKL